MIFKPDTKNADYAALATNAARALSDQEIGERQSRKLPPYHILSWEEFPFAFADVAPFEDATAKWHDAAPDNPQSWLYRAMARQAVKDWTGANTYLAGFQERAPDKPKARIRLGAEPTNTSEIVLPPVSGTYPSAPSLFLSCDMEYFQVMAMPLLRSIAEHSPETHVHVHLMVKEDSLRITPPPGLSISVTAENPSNLIRDLGIRPEMYYGAVRFVRFYEALAHSTGPLCMLDVDCLVNTSLQPLFERSTDLALRVRPGRIEPWHQLSACIVLARPNARIYFERVAELIKSALPHMWWGFDQYALFSSWIALQPNMDFLGPDVVGVVSDAEESMVWMTAGKNKRTLLTDQTPYALKFQRYFNGA